MEKKILSIFTRTPLHIGAGSSVGAIDQPVVRERHTRFPYIPGSSLKGVLSDLWPCDDNRNRTDEAVWLFGAEDASAASAGSLLIGEGKLLAFPVRSAKGSFAWTTCPIALNRFKRDSGASFTVPELTGEDCIAPDELCLNGKVILEEYVFSASTSIENDLVDALKSLSSDAVWHELEKRIVILSDEVFSYFAENACEAAPHIRVDDATGTVAHGALFNQENVPSETLFYTVIHVQNGKGETGKGKDARQALDALQAKISDNPCIQIGANETTGLGWCSVLFMEEN